MIFQSERESVNQTRLRFYFWRKQRNCFVELQALFFTYY